MAEKIKALMIFEILGRPADYIKKALEELLNNLEKIPGIKIDNRKIHEPKPFEDEKAKDLFTTFAEVEVTSDKIEGLTNIMFNALPSHVEILEPADLRLKNFEISSILTDLMVKIHKYDEITKGLALERNALIRRLQELEPKKETKQEIIKEITEEKPAQEKKSKPKKKTKN